MRVGPFLYQETMAIYDFNKEKLDYTQAFYELLLSIMTSGGGSIDLSAPRLSLIGSVRLKIDELQPQKEGVQFIQTNSNNVSNVLDMYINAILDESAKHILQTAPVHILFPVDGSACEVVQTPGKAWGHVKLTSDYLRFVSLKMNSWLQEVTKPILTTDPKYKLQKYSATMGGIAKPVAVINSIRKTNTPVKKVDTVTLAGSSGTANLACAGVLKTLTYATSLTITASAFVTANAAVYDAEGVVLTSSGANLIFTAKVAGVDFASPWVANVTGDLSGTTAHTTANVPAVETIRTLEYYSIGSAGTHTIDKFLFIGLTGAEFLQSNLNDALTWLCAAKILQIMGGVTGQDGSADKAMAQVQLSYQNLL